MATPSHGVLEEKHNNFLDNSPHLISMDEIARLKKELGILKNANPFRMAELAIEVQIERLRVVEISNARDAAVQRLIDAYISIRLKNELIERLQQETKDGNGSVHCQMQLARASDSVEIGALKAHIATLERTVEELRLIIQQQQQTISLKPSDPPPCYEESRQKLAEIGTQTDVEGNAEHRTTGNTMQGNSEVRYTPPETDDPTELADARNLALAAIPLPPNPPDATLSAVIIPPPFTLHEFLNAAPAALRNSLSNYRILHNVSTLWCPEREEHGYMYVPIFKCSTNPRIATAHRWAAVDVIGRMNKPTECFYNKEGVWYYAGSYKAFQMDTLSAKEFVQLPSETITAIVKETIAGRKNSSPQNTYETSQLYGAGALKVACVGLQCVGFNQEVYKSIIDHSIKFSDTKWKALTAAASASGPLASQAGPGTGNLGGNGISTAPGPTPSVKTPIIPRHIHRTSSHLSSGSSGSASASPSSQFGTPASSNGVLGFGSSLWSISTCSAGSPGISVDAAAKKVFEGGENMAKV